MSAEPADLPIESRQVVLPETAAQTQLDDEPSSSRETGSAEKQASGVERIMSAPVSGGRHVQHAGTWLMMAMAEQHQLYDAALEELWDEPRGARQIRLAIDAVIAALSIGERSVEGVRRLASSSADRPFRADQAPSVSWVRRVMKRFAGGDEKLNGWQLHLLLAGRYMRQAQAGSEQAVVFYVDNHMRPYMGKFVTRRGWLAGIILGRWCQENAFKHGVERWGINQLDGRNTSAYRPDSVIPNPARRRLDRDLRLARLDEGKARRELARLDEDDRRWEKVQTKLDDALDRQKDFEALRPYTPTHAPLEETELAGKLVYHPGNYKAVMGTIRIVCANAETDLAYTLAPYLRKPREAKKALANLFKAPGSIRMEQERILVRLNPVGTRSEKEPFSQLLEYIDDWHLVLPGDRERRPLRFRSHL